MNIIEIRAQSGVRNDLPPDRFSPGDLLTADNIELDETGKAHRRLGVSRHSTGMFHSLWSDVQDSYVVKDGVLSRFSGAGIAPIVPVVGRRLAYQRISDVVFWTDGVASGVLRGATNHPAGVELPQSPAISLTAGAFRPGAYLVCVTNLRADGVESGASSVQRVLVGENQGLTLTLSTPVSPSVTSCRVYVSQWDGEVPMLAATVPATSSTLTLSELPDLTLPVRTQYMSGPPPGQVLGYYKGRLYVARNNYLWYSQPYEYELFDRVGGYIGFSSPVRVFVPVSDGLFVGTESETVFLSGSDPDVFERVEVAPYGAVLGTEQEIPAHYFSDGSIQAPVWLWASERGVCMGASGGQFKDVTGGRYQLPASVGGASLFKIRGGTPQFITSLFA